MGTLHTLPIDRPRSETRHSAPGPSAVATLPNRFERYVNAAAERNPVIDEYVTAYLREFADIFALQTLVCILEVVPVPMMDSIHVEPLLDHKGMDVETFHKQEIKEIVRYDPTGGVLHALIARVDGNLPLEEQERDLYAIALMGRLHRFVSVLVTLVPSED